MVDNLLLVQSGMSNKRSGMKDYTCTRRVTCLHNGADVRRVARLKAPSAHLYVGGFSVLTDVPLTILVTCIYIRARIFFYGISDILAWVLTYLGGPVL